jgi:hypothetical protein
MYEISPDQQTLTETGTGLVLRAVPGKNCCQGCEFDYGNDSQCGLAQLDIAPKCVGGARNDRKEIIWVIDNTQISKDNASMNSTNSQKTAGYTYKLEWKEFHQWLGMEVNKSFYTTDDAIHVHLSAFAKQGIVPTVTKL